MSTIELLTTFFGWCTVINVGIYLLTVGGVTLARGLVARINARLFGIPEEEVQRMAFQYVAGYKLAITLLCFVPWLALTLMA